MRDFNLPRNLNPVRDVTVCVFIILYIFKFKYYYSVCVYYCSTYYKAVRGEGGRGRDEDMCYERLRAEASVN